MKLVTKILDNVPNIPPTVTVKIINSGLKFALCACSATTLGNETSGITYKNKNPPNPNEKKQMNLSLNPSAYVYSFSYAS